MGVLETRVSGADGHGRRRNPRRSGAGFSGACGQGIALARGEYILLMNGDFNHRVEDAVSLFDARRRAELVIGARFGPGGGTEDSYLRHLMSAALSLLITGYLVYALLRPERF